MMWENYNRKCGSCGIHTASYDGTQWLSDFQQGKQCTSNRSKAQDYHLFRHKGERTGA